MIKAINIGEPKPSRYIQVPCSWCKSILVANEDDIWIEAKDTISANVGRLTCPICRKKFFFILPDLLSRAIISNAIVVNESEYTNAHADMSKSGLQMLMDEKKKEAAECNNSVQE